jgi:hypothetical protein
MKVDGHLLIDLKNGDEKAFETLFWKYNEHVYHFIYSLLYEKSMAEDLTQGLYIRMPPPHKKATSIRYAVSSLSPKFSSLVLSAF